MVGFFLLIFYTKISTRALQVLIFLVTMEIQPINGGIT